MSEDLDPGDLPGLSKKVAAARSNGWRMTARQGTGDQGSVFVIYAQAADQWSLMTYGPEETKTWLKAGSGFSGYRQDGTNVLVDRTNSINFWKYLASTEAPA